MRERSSSGKSRNIRGGQHPCARVDHLRDGHLAAERTADIQRSGNSRAGHKHRLVLSGCRQSGRLCVYAHTQSHVAQDALHKHPVPRCRSQSQLRFPLDARGSFQQPVLGDLWRTQRILRAGDARHSRLLSDDCHAHEIVFVAARIWTVRSAAVWSPDGAVAQSWQFGGYFNACSLIWVSECSYQRMFVRIQLAIGNTGVEAIRRRYGTSYIIGSVANVMCK